MKLKGWTPWAKLALQFYNWCSRILSLGLFWGRPQKTWHMLLFEGFTEDPLLTQSECCDVLCHSGLWPFERTGFWNRTHAFRPWAWWSAYSPGMMPSKIHSQLSGACHGALWRRHRAVWRLVTCGCSLRPFWCSSTPPLGSTGIHWGPGMPRSVDDLALNDAGNSEDLPTKNGQCGKANNTPSPIDG